MRDPVLAAQKDALEVGVLHPLPGVEAGDEHRVVVGRRDSSVVEQDVDLTELLACGSIHLDHGVLVGEVDLEGELADLVLDEVDADDVGALSRE